MTVICEPDAWAAQVLAAAIGAGARTVPALGQVPAALAGIAGRCPVVIGAGVDLDDALRFTALLLTERPDARVVLVRRQPVEAETVRATAAGVFAVVDVRAHDQIAHACFRAAQPDAEGQILAVFAAKAGYGKTTLATNLALALRDGGARRVCLLDLDFDCGDIASVLDLPTTRTLAQLIGPGTVGELLASGELVTVTDGGLDCILAPVMPGDAERIRPARVGQLLRALASRYDAVVLDLPARFSPTVLLALDSAHHHVLVATPERPALKNLRQTLDILDLLGYSRSARSVLFNRSDATAAITASEVAAVVRGPIAAHVPSSRDVPASINQGVPLVAAQPGHPVSVAIQRFAERYAPVLPASGDARALRDRDSRLGCSPHQGGSNAGTTA
ncbi:MAG: P-loop NTPase [Actinobacteria bacterium]|nr:P-loop NTPase [Actinomycetota bacterium]